MSEVPTWTLWLTPVFGVAGALLGAVAGGLITWRVAREQGETQLLIGERRYRRSVAIEFVHHTGDVLSRCGQWASAAEASPPSEQLVGYGDAAYDALRLLGRSLDELRIVLPAASEPAGELFERVLTIYVHTRSGASVKSVHDASIAADGEKQEFVAMLGSFGLGNISDLGRRWTGESSGEAPAVSTKSV
jgi:hypothetical protein